MNAAGVRRFVAAVMSASPSREDVETITAGLRAMRREDRPIVVPISSPGGTVEGTRRFASVEDLRSVGIDGASLADGFASIGQWFAIADVCRPDPLLFIGAAANGGR